MKNRKDIISIVILIVLIIGVFVALILPTATKLQELKKSLYTERVELAKQKQQNTDIVSLSREYNELKENADKLDQALIPKNSDALLVLIEEMESLASSLQLEETLSIPSIPEPSDTTTKESEITLTLNGSYSGIFNFLEYLESQESYISFATLSLTQSEDNSFSATLGGKLYWR